MLLEPSDDRMIQFFRYLFVGGIAFVADYAGFTLSTFIMGKEGIGLAGATTVGFFIGLSVNFLLSKRFVFTQNAVVKNTWLEFFWYGVIGLIGWGLNVLLMYLLEAVMNVYVAKIIVSLIVLIYNFLARRIFLYR